MPIQLAAAGDSRKDLEVRFRRLPGARLSQEGWDGPKDSDLHAICIVQLDVRGVVRMDQCAEQSDSGVDGFRQIRVP